MRVVSIYPINSKKSKVLIDEGFAFPLYNKELELFNIKIGEDVKNYDTDILPFLKKRAVTRLMYILKSSDKTEKELIKKLIAAEYPKEVVRFAVLYCKKHGYINDSAYIRDDIECYKESKSKVQIKDELRKKGLDSGEINLYMEEVFVDEYAQIECILKNYDIKSLLENRKELERLVARLRRKGYPYSIIKECINNN